MKRFAAVGVVALTLVACSGGGGGGSNNALPSVSGVAFPVRQAMQSFFATNGVFNLSYTGANGATATIVYSVAPGAASVFENQAATSVAQTYTIPASATSSTGLYFYAQSTGALLGITDPGDYMVVTAGGLLPQSAQIGQGGTYYTYIDYADASKTTVVQGAQTVTYEVDADPASFANVALFCINTPITGGTVKQCYRIDTAVNVTAPQLVGLTSVTFQSLTHRRS